MKNGLLVEIFKENEVIDPRTVPTKNGPMTFYSQIGYVDLGGKFPVEFQIPLQDGQPFYTAGKYNVLMSKSCSVSQHGRLEFAREMFLIPANS
ncbi:Single-stranded DNA-binding protein [Vibrio crassostreae]|nr:Single-stranded DNA-binding protein [Vibrio crassostreae]